MLLPYSDNLSFIFMFTLWWLVWRFATRFRRNLLHYWYVYVTSNAVGMCRILGAETYGKLCAQNKFISTLRMHSHDLELRTIVSADPVWDRDMYVFPLPCFKTLPLSNHEVESLHSPRTFHVKKRSLFRQISLPLPKQRLHRQISSRRSRYLIFLVFIHFCLLLFYSFLLFLCFGHAFFI